MSTPVKKVLATKIASETKKKSSTTLNHIPTPKEVAAKLRHDDTEREKQLDAENAAEQLKVQSHHHEIQAPIYETKNKDQHAAM